MAETAKHHEKCPCSLGEFWGDKNCAAGCPGCECAELASTLPPTAAEPSEPKANGFDEFMEQNTEYRRIQEGCETQVVYLAHHAAKSAYQAGEQSGVRKGMQRALELVRGQLYIPEGSSHDEGVRECEAAILAAMEECQ